MQYQKVLITYLNSDVPFLFMQYMKDVITQVISVASNEIPEIWDYLY